MKPFPLADSDRKKVEQRMKDNTPTLYGCPVCLTTQAMPGRGYYACGHDGYNAVLVEIESYDATKPPPTKAQAMADIVVWRDRMLSGFWKVMAP